MANSKYVPTVYLDDSALEETIQDQSDQLVSEHEENSEVENSQAQDQPEIRMAEISRTFHIHRFNGENYLLWKRQMEIYMAENKLKPYILGTTVRTAETANAWDMKDAEAQAFLMRGLELDQLRYLVNQRTAAAMWAQLETIHGQRSDQSVQVLLDKFINAKMEEGEKIADYVARVTGMAHRLEDMDLEQKEPVIVAKIMGSLPTSFDHVRTAWYAVPKADQTVTKLTEYLVNEETLINTRESSTTSTGGSEAYNVRYKGNNARQRHNDNKQRGSSASQNRNRCQPTRRSGKCNYCDMPGHWARECYKKQRERGNNYSNQFLVAQSASQNRSKNSNDKGADLLVMTEFKTSASEDVWLADSGATEHM